MELEHKAAIEYVALASLIPYARNSRTHTQQQIKQIAASIKEFGFTNPILIDADNGIIAGHGRVMAAEVLGLDAVPCIRLAHLTETQKRAYIIADNRLALDAGWDEELLRVELEALKEVSFDMELLGFREEEMLAVMGQYVTTKKESSTKEVDTDEFAMECTCPRCGFEFNP